MDLVAQLELGDFPSTRCATLKKESQTVDEGEMLSTSNAAVFIEEEPVYPSQNWDAVCVLVSSAAVEYSFQSSALMMRGTSYNC